MKESYTSKRRVRKNFGKIDACIDMPSLIEVQTGSYSSFINNVDAYGEHCEFGLEEVFKSIFPIKDFSGNGELEFVKYELEEPKYDVDECIKRDMTYAAPIKATLRLVVWDIDEATGAKSVHDIKEQDVYMGDIPLMTDKGTFIFNGTERVVVSQMHRSPGVFFDHDKGKTMSSGKYLFAARVIPYRGSWLDFEFDAKDLIYARIDRRRKLPVTSILYSLYSKETEDRIKAGEKVPAEEIKGMDKEEILNYFYEADEYIANKKGWKVKFNPERMKGVKFPFDLVDAKTGKVVWAQDKKITPRTANKLVEDGLEYYQVSEEQLYGKFLAKAVFNAKTGEIIADAGAELNEEVLGKINEAKVKELSILYIDGVNVGPYIRNTLAADKNSCREEALLDNAQKVGVVATNATVRSHIYEQELNKIKHDLEVREIAAPELVPFIETDNFAEAKKSAIEYAKKFEDVDSLILGCTHYPLLKEYFREALPKVRIISQDELMGAKLANYLERHIEIDICLSRNRDYKFLFSNWNEHYQKVAAMLFPGIPVGEK